MREREKYCRLIYRLPSTFHNSHKTIYLRSEFLSFFSTFDRYIFLMSREFLLLFSYITFHYIFTLVSSLLGCLTHSRAHISQFACSQTYKAINFDNGFFLLFAHIICATFFVCTQIKVGPLKGFMHIVDKYICAVHVCRIILFCFAE